MDDLIKTLTSLGIGGGTIAIIVLVVKFVLPDVFAAIKARVTNSNAETKMITVLLADIDGYRRREADFRAALDSLPLIRAQLESANEKIEAANRKIAEQSELIKMQSEQIRELTAEIHQLKGHR